MIKKSCSQACTGNLLFEVKKNVLQEIKKLISNKKFLIKNEFKTTNIALINHILDKTFEETFKQLLLSTTITKIIFEIIIIFSSLS